MKRKKLQFPSALTILLIIAALVAVMTYFVPGGKFDTLAYNDENNEFVVESLDQTNSLPASQKVLDSLNIKIPLEKFTKGSISKPMGIPGTYQRVEQKPQGLFAFLKSPIRGMMDSIDVILFVLIIGGFIGITHFTGAFDVGIARLAVILKGRENLLIVLVTSLIALGGTTFGLAEETMAFYPILVPVFLIAGYDVMVALACIYLGSSIGTMVSTVNPFSTIIASDAAGINWTDGLTSRLIMLILGTMACIWYIIVYANKVKKDPEKSLLKEERSIIEAFFLSEKVEKNVKANPRILVILVVFSLCFVVMVFGVSLLHWWFMEMTLVFLFGAILIGIIAKIKESKFVEVFIKGAGDLLGVAFIIGLARGISVLMGDGMVGDTIVYHANQLTSGMEKGIFLNMLTLVYAGLSFFIPSSSGMAVLTMPIMAPLADGVGLGRELVVDAYQYGQGLFAFINPTGLIMASLAMVKVGYDKWLKFSLPLVGILYLMVVIYMTLMAYV